MPVKTVAKIVLSLLMVLAAVLLSDIHRLPEYLGIAAFALLMQWFLIGFSGSRKRYARITVYATLGTIAFGIATF